MAEKYGTLHEFACHPCAGAMLIFSVSFQFLVYVLPKRALTFTFNVYKSFPHSSTDKDSAHNAGDLGSIPELGRSPEGGKCYPTPVFWLEEFHEIYSPWGCKESHLTE